ncbi:MAG TPA: hypothetical protein VMN37_12000 [Gemmatimonadales bacterium]|nr:hypothetical protein [Gemmatimonadales bacterium]
MTAARTARTSLLPLLLVASGSVSRCELATESATGELRLRGTVRFLESEGGCWRLEAGDGRRYELRPGQAPPAVLRDGARVRLVARPSEGPAGVCRAAMPVDVRRVESVEGP